MNSSCNCDCKNVFRSNKVSSCLRFVNVALLGFPFPVILRQGQYGEIHLQETIVVTLLNKTDAPQTVTVSVLDWQNCAQEEMPKEAFCMWRIATFTFL